MVIVHLLFVMVVFSSVVVPTGLSLILEFVFCLGDVICLERSSIQVSVFHIFTMHVRFVRSGICEAWQ